MSEHSQGVFAMIIGASQARLISQELYGPVELAQYFASGGF